MKQQSAEEGLSLSRFASVVLADGETRVRSLLSDRGVATDDPAVLLVLQCFSRTRTTSEVARELDGLVGREDLERIIGELREVDVLVVRAEDSSGWEPHDLAFHDASTIITQAVKRPGGSAGAAQRTPSSAPTWSLPRCTAPPRAPAVDVMRARRSTREFAQTPISVAHLGALLDLAAAEVLDERGRSTGRRPYPSGGGVHSLEIYPVLPRGVVADLEAGVFRYSATRHELELVSADPAVCTHLGEAAAAMMGHGPGKPTSFAVLLVTSRYGRVCDAYRQIAYRLALLEVGCLMQNVYLAAGTLGLGACALGGVPKHEHLAEWLQLDRLQEPALGQIAIGPLRSADQELQ